MRKSKKMNCFKWANLLKPRARKKKNRTSAIWPRFTVKERWTREHLSTKWTSPDLDTNAGRTKGIPKGGKRATTANLLLNWTFLVKDLPAKPWIKRLNSHQNVQTQLCWSGMCALSRSRLRAGINKPFANESPRKHLGRLEHSNFGESNVTMWNVSEIHFSPEIDMKWTVKCTSGMMQSAQTCSKLIM